MNAQQPHNEARTPPIRVPHSGPQGAVCELAMDHPITQRPAGRCVAPGLVRRQGGLSLIELVLAMSITGMLLTATMVALDASFYAYASAAEEASTQAQTRMIVNRLITLLRTSTAHGPTATSMASNPLETDYIEFQDPKGNFLSVGYSADTDELWLAEGLISTNAGLTKQLLLSGVSDATFFTNSRRDNTGVWVLERATMDLTVLPSPDSSLAMEKGAGAPIRVIASTMPRKLD